MSICRAPYPAIGHKPVGGWVGPWTPKPALASGPSEQGESPPACPQTWNDVNNSFSRSAAGETPRLLVAAAASPPRLAHRSHTETRTLAVPRNLAIPLRNDRRGSVSLDDLRLSPRFGTERATSGAPPTLTVRGGRPGDIGPKVHSPRSGPASQLTDAQFCDSLGHALLATVALHGNTRLSQSVVEAPHQAR
jgi:hypothetical protein